MLAETFTAQHNLQVVEPPVRLPRAKYAAYWHERSQKDSGHRWFRGVLLEVARTLRAGSLLAPCRHRPCVEGCNGSLPLVSAEARADAVPSSSSLRLLPAGAATVLYVAQVHSERSHFVWSPVATAGVIFGVVLNMNRIELVETIAQEARDVQG